MGLFLRLPKPIAFPPVYPSSICPTARPLPPLAHVSLRDGCWNSLLLVFISLGLRTNVRHRAIPQGILLSLCCNNCNLLHMEFPSFKSLLDGCHLMLTEETGFEVVKYGGRSGTCPLQHRLTAHNVSPDSREVGGDMLVIYLVPSGSLCRASRLAVSWRVGWGGGQELLLLGLREELGPALPAGARSGHDLRNAHLKSQGLSSVTVQSPQGRESQKCRGKPRTRGWMAN